MYVYEYTSTMFEEQREEWEGFPRAQKNFRYAEEPFETDTTVPLRLGMNFSVSRLVSSSFGKMENPNAFS